MTSEKPNRREEGGEYEEIALAFLLRRGLRLVKRNFRFGKAGEIDLVMRDGEIYVFVEVKGRRNHNYGLPEEAVTPSKRRQIRRVAEGFVHVMQIREYEARFDVVAIDFTNIPYGDDPAIRHYANAF
jgi:putative endonuclease